MANMGETVNRRGKAGGGDIKRGAERLQKGPRDDDDDAKGRPEPNLGAFYYGGC